MFNLEQSIADWRQQMLAAGIKSPVPLDELEIHLREEIERQVKLGLSEPKAFEISVQRIGQPKLLKREFKKSERKTMKQYISKIIVGCLGICIGFALCSLTFVGSKAEAKATEITVSSNGSLYLGNQQLDLSELSAGLKKQAAHGYTITILADKNTDCKRIIAVVNACKAAGVTQIAMRTSATQ